MTSRGDWFGRLDWVSWPTQQTPYERVAALMREMVVAQYGLSAAGDLAAFAHQRVNRALADLQKDIEELESDLRLHKEERIRLRGEVMRLERELRSHNKPTCVRMGLEDCGCRK